MKANLTFQGVPIEWDGEEKTPTKYVFSGYRNEKITREQICDRLDELSKKEIPMVDQTTLLELLEQKLEEQRLVYEELLRKQKEADSLVQRDEFAKSVAPALVLARASLKGDDFLETYEKIDQVGWKSKGEGGMHTMTYAEALAHDAYIIADAMMKERSK